jgi:uncharacterized protein YybS (DUF2232 family)
MGVLTCFKRLQMQKIIKRKSKYFVVAFLGYQIAIISDNNKIFMVSSVAVKTPILLRKIEPPSGSPRKLALVG